MVKRLDLNCDLGEGRDWYELERDTAIFPYVTSVNVACGFHAGTPRLIEAVIAEAVCAGLAVGAHPSLPDRSGFGRRRMAVETSDLYADTLYQIGALSAMTAACGAQLQHVKPHGALYHQLSTDACLAEAFLKAVAAIDTSLVIVGPDGSCLLQAAESMGLRTAREGFADRLYRADGSLMPRTAENSVHHVHDRVLEQASALANGTPFRGENDEQVTVRIETLCLHSDTPGAVELARAIRETLELQGVQVYRLS